MLILGLSIAPNLPYIYDVRLLNIAIDVNKFASSFSADYCDMALEFRNELVKLEASAGFSSLASY